MNNYKDEITPCYFLTFVFIFKCKCEYEYNVKIVIRFNSDDLVVNNKLLSDGVCLFLA